MPDSTVWVKTPVAAQITGRSRSQLMRLKEAGWLVHGTHFLKGPYENSPLTWNCSAIQETLARLAPTPAPEPPQSPEVDDINQN